MKKFYILFVVLLFVTGACQKSQFSTTTRQTKNGKVTYTNHYRAERIKFAKVKSPKYQNSPPDVQIQRSFTENLIASTLNEPVIISISGNLVANNELNLFVINADGLNSENPSMDTVRSHKQNEEPIDELFNRQIIKYKDGQVKTVKIVSQSNDTLMYRLVNEPNIVRGVMMEQIDTIIQDSTNAKAEYIQRTEKLGLLGLIFSMIGLIPIVGIPFALVGIINGSTSLRRMKRVKGIYKRKGMAIASIIIGCLALVGNIIFIIFLAGYGMGGMSLGLGV